MSRYLKFFILIIVLSGCQVNKNQSSTAAHEVSQSRIIACGNFNVYILNQEGTGYIRIFVDANKYALQAENQFDLSTTSPVLVEQLLFEEDITQTLCSDVMIVRSPKLIESKSAIEGMLSITLNRENLSRYKQHQQYAMDISLKGVKFTEGDSPIFIRLNAVGVGWMPG